MSLKRKLQAAVDKAFNAAGDLKLSGKLLGEKVTGYDLTLGEVVSTQAKTLNLKVILTESSKQDDSTTTYSAIIKSGVNLSVYKYLLVNSLQYKINGFDDNGFVITISLSREV